MLVIINDNFTLAQDGRGALHYATNAGNYEIVKMLVKGFANVNLLAKVQMRRGSKSNNPVSYITQMMTGAELTYGA